MNSLWKDLVYVHSRMLWREDLQWREQLQSHLDGHLPGVGGPCDDGGGNGQQASHGSKKGPSHWPRLVAPR